MSCKRKKKKDFSWNVNNKKNVVNEKKNYKGLKSKMNKSCVCLSFRKNKNLRGR